MNEYWFCIIRAKEHRRSSTANLPRRRSGPEMQHACAPAPVTATTQRLEPPVPDEGPPYATHEDLIECCGLILGTPTALEIWRRLSVFLGRYQLTLISGALVASPPAFLPRPKHFMAARSRRCCR